MTIVPTEAPVGLRQITSPPIALAGGHAIFIGKSSAQLIRTEPTAHCESLKEQQADRLVF
jgi:hypothetical protein